MLFCLIAPHLLNQTPESTRSKRVSATRCPKVKSVADPMATTLEGITTGTGACLRPGLRILEHIRIILLNDVFPRERKDHLSPKPLSTWKPTSAKDSG